MNTSTLQHRCASPCHQSWDGLRSSVGWNSSTRSAERRQPLIAIRGNEKHTADGSHVRRLIRAPRAPSRRFGVFRERGKQVEEIEEEVTVWARHVVDELMAQLQRLRVVFRLQHPHELDRMSKQTQRT